MILYDLAGNYSEWTLEQRYNNAYPNISRGGGIDADAIGVTSPAAAKNNGYHAGNSFISFRATFY